MPTNNLFDPEFVNAADIGDLEELQAELQRLLFEVSPQRGLRDTMRLAIGMLHRYATGIVHVDKGRLKNSIFWNLESPAGNDLIGHVATNVSYSIIEERRGGSHAFFARTVREEGPHVNDLFGVRIMGPGR